MTERTARGIREAILGPNQEFRLTDPLDTWVAEARGSSARVFNGSLRTPIQSQKSCAVKIMRGDRADYALPLFREEIQVLALLRDVQGITPLLECGFIQLDSGHQLPTDTRNISADELSGTVLRFAPEEIVGFLAEMELRAHNGWLPYLAIEKYQQSDNLLQYCDIGHTHGRFLPLDILLGMAIQISISWKWPTPGISSIAITKSCIITGWNSIMGSLLSIGIALPAHGKPKTAGDA